MSKTEIKCDNCGKKFYKYDYRIKQASKHFCSTECSNAYRRGRTHSRKFAIDFVIDENGCFICTSHKPGKRGYPRMHNKYVFHHVYEEMFGERPEGKVIRHLCDNKLCINPEHLRIGTQKENVRDAIRNGKFVIGSKRSQAKLDELKVAAIKTLMKYTDMTDRELGHCFNVSTSAITLIRSGVNWKHVESWD